MKQDLTNNIPFGSNVIGNYKIWIYPFSNYFLVLLTRAENSLDIFVDLFNPTGFNPLFLDSRKNMTDKSDLVEYEWYQMVKSQGQPLTKLSKEHLKILLESLND